MIFVDTNVFMYAVGRPHPLRGTAREFFIESNRNRAPLCTSAEVLQELVHAYLPVARWQTLDAAMARSQGPVWKCGLWNTKMSRWLGNFMSSIQHSEHGTYATSPVAAGVV